MGSKVQKSFRRTEKKYLLDAAQYERLRQELAPYMEEDEYGLSLIMSLYYDTDSFDMIRRSLEKPTYKEKLRLRSYGVPNGNDSMVFVELKKKFKGVVYKRRVELPEHQAQRWLEGGDAPDNSQICREIDWVLRRYKLSPKIVICCDREAWVDKENPHLRLTLDKSIRYREDELSLSAGDHGRELLEEGGVLMEIKMPGSAPLWLAELLSEAKVFPAGFSKYGRCYEQKLIENYFSGVMEYV